MKGISMFLAGIIVSFFVIIAALMPFLVTKIHMERLILYELRTTNAHAALLSLLSLTEIDSLDSQTKRVGEILAEHIAFNNKPDISFLGPRLDELVRSQTYKLFYIDGGEVVLAQSGNPIGATAVAIIPLPYELNRISKEMILVID